MEGPSKPSESILTRRTTRQPTNLCVIVAKGRFEEATSPCRSAGSMLAPQCRMSRLLAQNSSERASISSLEVPTKDSSSVPYPQLRYSAWVKRNPPKGTQSGWPPV